MGGKRDAVRAGIKRVGHDFDEDRFLEGAGIGTRKSSRRWSRSTWVSPTATPLFKREQWQAVPGNLVVAILEVVLPRPSDDVRATHGGRIIT